VLARADEQHGLAAPLEVAWILRAGLEDIGGHGGGEKNDGKKDSHQHTGRAYSRFMPEERQNVSEEDAVPIVINGELDLHTFRPSELGSLLPEYFAECRKRNILTVRVIHGKGTGALRESVHQLLTRTRGVVDWTWPVAPPYGGWGATFVRLSCIDCEQG
jgi:hypothetical protein